MGRINRLAVATAAITAIMGGGLLPSVASAATPSVTPAVTAVVSGLNNPRGVAVVNGHLYVAEAGTGGTDCPAGAQGPEGGQLCVGQTGALAEIIAGTPHDVLSNLFSESDIPGGVAAEGIADVAGVPGGLRALYGESVVGLLTSMPQGSHLTAADGVAARQQLGKLTAVAGGHNVVLADVGDSDFSWAAVHKNLVPHQFPDANPNAFAVVGDTTYVADAGSNTLDSVDSAGHVSQLAFLPNPAHSDAVPTCVAVGPDNNLYLGELAPGAPANGGNVYRYDVATHHLTVWKTGFNVVDGCGFDRAGNFYAVEFQAHGFNPGPTGDPRGDVIKVAPNGTRTTLGAGHLFFPQGFALDGKGGFYVSNYSIFPGFTGGGPTGQVVRVGP
jgi:hypothetical protein